MRPFSQLSFVLKETAEEYVSTDALPTATSAAVYRHLPQLLRSLYRDQLCLYSLVPPTARALVSLTAVLAAASHQPHQCFHRLLHQLAPSAARRLVIPNARSHAVSRHQPWHSSTNHWPSHLLLTKGSAPKAHVRKHVFRNAHLSVVPRLRARLLLPKGCSRYSLHLLLSLLQLLHLR